MKIARKKAITFILMPYDSLYLQSILNAYRQYEDRIITQILYQVNIVVEKKPRVFFILQLIAVD